MTVTNQLRVGEHGSTQVDTQAGRHRVRSCPARIGKRVAEHELAERRSLIDQQPRQRGLSTPQHPPGRRTALARQVRTLVGVAGENVIVVPILASTGSPASPATSRRDRYSPVEPTRWPAPRRPTP